MKKKIYLVMIVASALLASADSTDFKAWLIWEAVWLSVFVISFLLFMKEDEKDDGLQ